MNDLRPADLRPRLYIAGPMTGLENFNFHSFDYATAEFNKLGWDVVNPAEIGRQFGLDKTHHFYMRKALESLVTCGAIFMLPGWEKSKGASLEFQVATALGFLEVHNTEVFGQLAQPHGSTAAKSTERTNHEPAIVTLHLTPGTVGEVHNTLLRIFGE